MRDNRDSEASEIQAFFDFFCKIFILNSKEEALKASATKFKEEFIKNGGGVKGFSLIFFVGLKKSLLSLTLRRERF